MPKQNECDHIVGLSYTTVHLSHVYNHKSHAWVTTKYDYCPSCGEKIDWDEIKEMVKNEN